MTRPGMLSFITKAALEKTRIPRISCFLERISQRLTHSIRNCHGSPVTSTCTLCKALLEYLRWYLLITSLTGRKRFVIKCSLNRMTGLKHFRNSSNSNSPNVSVTKVRLTNSFSKASTSWRSFDQSR